MILLTQVPFVMSIYYSLTDWKVVPPGPREFVGLDNYRELFDDDFFGDAIWVSIQLTVFPVLAALVLGTAFAILLDRKFFGRGVVRTLLITPFLLMPVVIGLIWKNQMFHGLYGVINWVIEKLGGTPVEFVSEHPTAVDRHHADLAVDAVHDADHAGRPAEPAVRTCSRPRRSTGPRRSGSSVSSRSATCARTWSSASCSARST